MMHLCGLFSPGMPTPEQEHRMRRCLQLAVLGATTAAPNPLVGAVLVRSGQVLAEGWHKVAGGPHAEVECLRAFGHGSVPADAIMYVNLEPCAHHGRTPPCADLLIVRGVRHVVVGQRDPFPQVAGEGIRRLKSAGIQVTEDVLPDACRWTQRRFLASVEQGRPYIVLKWARSADGFLDRHPRAARGVQRISSPRTDVLVHRWRTEEQAVLVGSRTVVNDDPSLTVRHVEGRQPLRIVLDRNSITPAASRLYTDGLPTLLFTGKARSEVDTEQVITDDGDPIGAMLAELHRRNVRSVLIEGGAELLGHFLRRGLWDEARVITGAVSFGSGTRAPELAGELVHTTSIDKDRVELFTPRHTVDAVWDW